MKEKESHLIFIRHGEKDLLKKVTDDFHIPLTPQGQKDAFELGIKIQKKYGRIRKLRSSPLLRTMETASSLLAGNQSSCETETSSLLGHPGAFIADSEKAAMAFSSLPVETVLKKQLSSETIPGFYPTPRGIQALLDQVIEDLNSPLSVYISHDVILLPLIHHFFPQEIEILWPDYLEGLIFKKGSTAVEVFFRGKTAFLNRSSSDDRFR